MARHWSAVLVSLCFPLSGRVPHGFYRATTILDQTIGWKTLKLQHRWLAARMRLFCTSTPHTMFPLSRSLNAHRSSVVIGDVCVNDRLLLERRAAGSSVRTVKPRETLTARWRRLHSQLDKVRKEHTTLLNALFHIDRLGQSPNPWCRGWWFVFANANKGYVPGDHGWEGSEFGPFMILWFYDFPCWSYPGRVPLSGNPRGRSCGASYPLIVSVRPGH